MTDKPTRNLDLKVLEVNDEAILYTVSGEVLHSLNPTARVLWDLCDGEHTAADMEAELRARFSVPSDVDLRADVAETLEVFATKGLIASD